MIIHLYFGILAIPPTPPPGVSPTQVVTPTAAPSINDPCRDQNPNCGQFNMPQTCIDYAAWSRDNCNRTCQFCTRKFTVDSEIFVKILFSGIALKDILVM